MLDAMSCRRLPSRKSPNLTLNGLLLAAGLSLAGVALADEITDEPFVRTEDRPPCAHYSETRQPFFGQLHLHTQYSLDAATLQTRNTPRDAYRFAKGEPVGLAPFFDTRRLASDETGPAAHGVSSHPYCLPPESCEFTAMRTLQLAPGRALDFAAVTDHSEFLGETNICFFETATCNETGDPGCCSTDADCGSGQTCNLPPAANLPRSNAQGTCAPVGYNSQACQQVRDQVSGLLAGTGVGLFIGDGWLREFPQHLPFCNQDSGDGDDTCTFQAKNVWQQIIASAEEAYDRTASCEFTSFIGYEYTAMPAMRQCSNSFEPCFADADCPGQARGSCGSPGQCTSPTGKMCFSDSECHENGRCITNGGGNNIHRNIIFRGSNVPNNPISYIDVPTGCGDGVRCRKYTGSSAYPKEAGTFSTSLGGVALGSPSVMLETLRDHCGPDDDRPCDFISIPHNSNLSGGAMFMMPESPEDAQLRSDHERLVEIFQIKGDSECRYSPEHALAWQPGAFVADELCGFEDMRFAKLTGAFLIDPDARSVPPSGYVRNALKDGLAYERETGINPFKLGFVGSLDNHNGTPTATEVHYSKNGAHGNQSFTAPGQMLNEAFFLGLETNGGGLTAVWAEENSRDSLFAGMKRRETYATSGTRPTLRVFGGFDLPKDMCEQGEFASRGYQFGVPMGDNLRPPAKHSKTHGPTFAVSALMDTGWAGHPGASLQRVQIVKGWVDGKGQVLERVYDIAGSAEKVPVDLETCTPGGLQMGGAAHLCSVWTDPDFDPELHAFYYARLLENPSCRWNQYYCLDRGIDCRQPPVTDRDVVGYNAYEYQQCCSHEVPKTVQQRAWGSPIWWAPLGAGK